VTKTLQDYEDALFVEEDEEFIFSSGTYRIDAVRLVHVICPLARNENATLEEIDNAETRLANWQMHLPDCKRRLVSKTGELDEIMFGAHMIVSSCTILLHRPRSDLSHNDVRSITTCANSPLVILADQPELHTLKSMNAAMEICLLIKMPSPLVKHTPFFTCAINLAAVVYLSYWSFIATEPADSVVKEHIKLNIGSLKALSKVMPIAHTVLGQAKGVARELFKSRKALSNEYYGGNREEVLNSIIELSEENEAEFVGLTGSGNGVGVGVMDLQQHTPHVQHEHQQQLQLGEGHTHHHHHHHHHHAPLTPVLGMNGLPTTDLPATTTNGITPSGVSTAHGYFPVAADINMTGSAPLEHPHSLATVSSMPLSIAGVGAPVLGGLGHTLVHPPVSGI
jgi:hypothetical protein